MEITTLTRRTVLRTAALATTVLTTPFVRHTAAATVVPKGKMVLAWHTNIAARWLDPQQHDGTASGDNFLMALHDALIKNFREVRYDHPALAERYEFAEDANSATFRLGLVGTALFLLAVIRRRRGYSGAVANDENSVCQPVR